MYEFESVHLPFEWRGLQQIDKVKNLDANSPLAQAMPETSYLICQQTCTRPPRD